MHLLYLDESGSVDNPNEEYFVLGGISVPESSVRWLSHKLDELAANYEKDAPAQVEFHAAEIFSGRNPPWNLVKEKAGRKNIILSVLNTLRGAKPDLVIFACAIHKKSFPGENLVVKAYEDISSRFDLYLHHISRPDGISQKGLIILDRCSYEAGLQNLAAQIRKEGNRWGSYTKRICEIPMFVESSAARNVQLADHIAYAVFRRYNAGDLTYFNAIEQRFDQWNGVFHGLAHIQRDNPNCTCPACFSRRDRV